ncbi:uncharacterized protein C8Q71DRAFT_213565 [Rhodofomes roseus]|uniref:Uncharacterized protein n=1 Tax=Rhodofomes roseus TaxID=34475 RepID=A0ABQ8KV03_9APHY|nr:uncharacterized protein C8Q71DRAFT_213565 [Rhodofomes roseus]KAH9842641.1 hypothetical protein C8Q71DRAFT_213565 [Rhodofomes roseus]
MTSRHRTRTTHTQRQEDAPSWTPNEPEPGYSRQAMASTQRHNAEQTTADGHRKHRSSSKRAETSDAVAPSAPVTSHSKSSSKHRTSAQPSTSYHGTYPGANATSSAAPVATPSSRTHGAYYADDTSRSYARTKTDKPSPRSSNERVAMAEDSRSARHARSAYPTMATVQAPASTQAYYIDPSQAVGETSSSKHRRERDKDRDKERERERRREEKAKAKLQEAESLRAKEKERDRERRRERDREVERASRDREGHRDSERTRERESSRRKEERKAAERASSHVQANTTAYRPQQVDDRLPTASVSSDHSSWSSDLLTPCLTGSVCRANGPVLNSDGAACCSSEWLCGVRCFNGLPRPSGSSSGSSATV